MQIERSANSRLVFRNAAGGLLARGLAALGAVALAASLAGCASTVADHLPAAAGGLPANAPERSAQPVAYPAVHDMPPPRQDTVLTDDEVAKAEAEMVAARDRQEHATAPQKEKSAKEKKKRRADPATADSRTDPATADGRADPAPADR